MLNMLPCQTVDKSIEDNDFRDPKTALRRALPPRDIRNSASLIAACCSMPPFYCSLLCYGALINIMADLRGKSDLEICWQEIFNVLVVVSP